MSGVNMFHTLQAAFIMPLSQPLLISLSSPPSLLWCCSHPPHIACSISLSTKALFLNDLVWRRNIFLLSAQSFFCSILLELLTGKLYSSILGVNIIALDKLLKVSYLLTHNCQTYQSVSGSFCQKVLKVQSVWCI